MYNYTETSDHIVNVGGDNLRLTVARTYVAGCEPVKVHFSLGQEGSFTCYQTTLISVSHVLRGETITGLMSMFETTVKEVYSGHTSAFKGPFLIKDLWNDVMDDIQYQCWATDELQTFWVHRDGDAYRVRAATNYRAAQYVRDVLGIRGGFIQVDNILDGRGQMFLVLDSGAKVVPYEG